MYKLLIVEDEKWEREGLVEFLDWSALDIAIAGLAANGQQGLKMARECRPDIILTDIKMPLMDGLEFTREVRKFSTECKIIILTGYDDFEYAREAILLGVFDYLLKPIRREEITELLNRTVQRIGQERSEVETVHALKRQWKESVYEEREIFLQEVLEGKAEGQLQCSLSEVLPSALSARGVTAAVIAYDSRSGGKDRAASEEGIAPDRMFRWVQTVAGNDAIVARSRTGRNEILLCFPVKDGEPAAGQDILHRLGQEDAGFVIPAAVIGVGASVDSISRFAESYGQAKMAVEQLFFRTGEEVLRYADLHLPEGMNEPGVYRFFSSAAEYSKKILNGVVSLDPPAITGLLEELMEYIRRTCTDKNLVCGYFAGLIGELSMLLPGSEEEGDISGLAGTDPGNTLNQFIRIQDMKQWLLAVLLGVNARITGKRSKKEENIVRKVTDIIHTEYGDGIGIETIACRMGVSPNYLGGLFKKHTGKRFTEALTDYRMEKAMERLGSGEENVLETSKAVGFVNVGYFCTVFKKMYGSSPAEYRKNRLKSAHYE